MNIPTIKLKQENIAIYWYNTSFSYGKQDAGVTAVVTAAQNTNL